MFPLVRPKSDVFQKNQGQIKLTQSDAKKQEDKPKPAEVVKDAPTEVKPVTKSKLEDKKAEKPKLVYDDPTQIPKETKVACSPTRDTPGDCDISQEKREPEEVKDVKPKPGELKITLPLKRQLSEMNDSESSSSSSSSSDSEVRSKRRKPVHVESRDDSQLSDMKKERELKNGDVLQKPKDCDKKEKDVKVKSEVRKDSGNAKEVSKPPIEKTERDKEPCVKEKEKQKEEKEEKDEEEKQEKTESKRKKEGDDDKKSRKKRKLVTCKPRQSRQKSDKGRCTVMKTMQASIKIRSLGATHQKKVLSMINDCTILLGKVKEIEDVGKAASLVEGLNHHLVALEGLSKSIKKTME